MKIKKLLSKSNILILTPLILVMILDFIVTSVGQPAAYWQDPSLVNEGNLVARYLLVQHYGYFVLGSFIYGFLVLFLVLTLRRPINIMLAVYLFIAHGFGIATWIPTIFKKIIGTYPTANTWWYLITGYFIIVSVISGLCIDKWFKIKNSK